MHLYQLLWSGLVPEYLSLLTDRIIEDQLCTIVEADISN